MKIRLKTFLAVLLSVISMFVVGIFVIRPIVGSLSKNILIIYGAYHTTDLEQKLRKEHERRKHLDVAENIISNFTRAQQDEPYNHLFATLQKSKCAYDKIEKSSNSITLPKSETYTFKITGQYQKIIAFMNEIENSNYICTFTKIEIRSASVEIATISADLSLTYYLVGTVQ